VNYIAPPSSLGPGSIVWAYLRDSGGDAQEQSVPQQRAEILPDALAAALQSWICQIYESKESGDIRALKSLLLKFISKIDLGYNNARIWYTYPIGARSTNGVDLKRVGGTFPIPLVRKALVISWE
jgi:hypothetical protein